MGKKRNNNNDKHQKLETIPWYLCRKLDMLGRRRGHLVTAFHQSDSSAAAAGGGGKNFFLYGNAQARRRGRVLRQDRHDNKGLLSVVAPLQTLDTQDGHLFSPSLKAWLHPPAAQSTIFQEVAAPRTPKAEDQSWSSEVGSNINSLGFPPETKYNDKRTSRQEESSSSHGSDAQKVTWLPRPLRAPSCSPHAPHELVMQVRMYASQVVDMRRQVDCVKFSLQQEQEKQRIVEKKTQELREMLSHELVESQRNHVELWAKLELEQQERAKFGACLSLLSETVAQGYSQDHFKKDRVSEGEGGGAISSLLNPTELQLVNQLREAKNLRSLAEARIETLKTQVQKLEIMCDSVNTFQKVCYSQESVWRYGLFTLVQATFVCFGVAVVVFGRGPALIMGDNLLPS
ncbi:unnamed protein product [Sphagnum troendelagicum]|uniref:Uncharacterized protein n=1 Tax=Sphagnum troendelagicum TaxID=128251 RepID=A0ABP0URU2_9BRYO